MKKTIKKILKAIIYSNYHICALSFYCWKSERKALMRFAKKVQEMNGKKLLPIVLDMMWANFINGCNFEEYYALRFFLRTPQNRKTFLTRAYNHVIVYKYNNYDYTPVLDNKLLFYQRFAEFRKVPLISLGEDKEKVVAFLSELDQVIIKPESGDSGQGIFAASAKEILEKPDLDAWLSEHKNYICEKRLYNHEVINLLNESSLNSLRAIVFHGKLVFISMRVGPKGQIIDNLTRGGASCTIDPETGKFCREAIDKGGHPVSLLPDGQSLIGFQLPYWEETKELITKVSLSFPEMKFVAWDFAITPDGPVLVEGNSGVDNRISQAFLSPEEEGLRARMNEIIREDTKK